MTSFTSESSTEHASNSRASEGSNINIPVQRLVFPRSTSLSYIEGQHSHESLPMRPRLDRRVTWDEASFEKNAIAIPDDLRRAGRAQKVQAKEKKYASWFEDSPHDLDERRELRRESEEWVRDVRRWRKAERRRSREKQGEPGWYMRLLKQMKEIL